jgi:hypothetical protein
MRVPKGQDPLNFASRCLRTLTATNSEQQRQISVLDFLKPSSGTRVSPPVLFDIGYDKAEDLPTIQ